MERLLLEQCPRTRRNSVSEDGSKDPRSKDPYRDIADHLLHSRRMAKSRKRDAPLTSLFYRHVRWYSINQRLTNNVDSYSYGTDRDWDNLPSWHGISCSCAPDSRSCLQLRL